MDTLKVKQIIKRRLYRFFFGAILGELIWAGITWMVLVASGPGFWFEIFFVATVLNIVAVYYDAMKIRDQSDWNKTYFGIVFIVWGFFALAYNVIKLLGKAVDVALYILIGRV